ncbi:permease-like cell division protein FtsX [Candidatus Dojkabacteria bacterium]|uniref:Cell division protein FtsX n=1 Tax=Candidatus Dojkabacteria bacterium TaxID=2099670 RepID=A0A955L5C3_9BACT|nr:permease-like cell division protein FtsX [Candidatus Dojkabacteria bacterium]
MFTHFKRIISTTWKQIRRSGWLSWASILVMALAFFIAIIFIILAYVSNLFLQSIENEPHIYVFFNTGVSEENVLSLKQEWESLDQIELIEYTSEENALEEFTDSQSRSNPQVAENIRENVLPASLGIRLFSIEDANEIINIVSSEQETNDDIYAVVFSQETIDTIRSLFYWLRIGGGIIMGLLLVVIFSFTLLTVEFRTFNRAEEIGIMQLVGGSLWFIRAPFIFEGAFYGMLGSLISSSIIYILTYVIFVVNRDAGAVSFVINFFDDLRWPAFHIEHFIVIFVGLVALGSIVGALNSLVAIRRYIR